jgi:iron(III) transport system substrate-binding protein
MGQPARISIPDPRPLPMRPRRVAAVSFLCLIFLGGCGGREGIVAYTALDREFSEPVYEAYEARTGRIIRSKYDIESAKTVGLAQAIVTEAKRPQCDLFWNNEILNTLRLQKKGLLAPIDPPNGANIPAVFKDKGGEWFGFAARARILLINTDLVPDGDRPSSILDLTDPKWKGKIGLAKPLFGTTATHAVCLFSVWGDDKAKAYYRGLKSNDVQIFSGNKQVAQAVGSGAISVGMTDTDDAMEEVASGHHVKIVYPDNSPDGLGTLFVPNTVAVIKGCPHPAEAAALLDYLISPEVESALANGPSVQIPLNAKTETPARIETPKTVKPMAVDFSKAVDLWDSTAAFLAEEFAGG